MARSKQSTPLRREPSSEYTSKVDGTPSRKGGSSEKLVNGNVNGIIEGSEVERVLENVVPGVKEAGALQFLIAVGGIYGSL